jgi:predicted RNA-binding protein with PIN domain
VWVRVPPSAPRSQPRRTVSLLIIDGNNVMGARPWTRWWRDRANAAQVLSAEIEARLDGIEDATVVFDGRAPADGPSTSPVVRVRYAGADGASADDLIVTLVEGADTDEVTVVTSDRELASRVGALGARVEGAGTFVRRLGLSQ